MSARADQIRDTILDHLKNCGLSVSLDTSPGPTAVPLLSVNLADVGTLSFEMGNKGLDLTKPDWVSWAERERVT